MQDAFKFCREENCLFLLKQTKSIKEFCNKRRDFPSHENACISYVRGLSISELWDDLTINDGLGE